MIVATVDIVVMINSEWCGYRRENLKHHVDLKGKDKMKIPSENACVPLFRLTHPPSHLRAVTFCRALLMCYSADLWLIILWTFLHLLLPVSGYVAVMTFLLFFSF